MPFLHLLSADVPPSAGVTSVKRRISHNSGFMEVHCPINLTSVILELVDELVLVYTSHDWLIKLHVMVCQRCEELLVR